MIRGNGPARAGSVSWGAVLLLGLIWAWGSGCRPALPSAIRIAHEGEALSLDPNVTTEDVTFSILSNFYEALATFDGRMALVPGLAAHWSSLDDESWEMEIRQGVRFHDGGLLTAADVKQALEAARDDPASDVRQYLEPIRTIEVEDAHRLRLRTSRKEPSLMGRLAYVFIGRESRAPGPARFAGTGPYRPLRWEKGRFLDAEAFDAYWGGRPPIRRARFVHLSEEASLEALGRGEVDVVRDLSEAFFARLGSLRGVRPVWHPGLASWYLWMNSLPAPGNPFADRRVRQAISRAVDRAALVERLGGHAFPLQHLVPASVAGHAHDLSVPAFAPDEARRLLGEAGLPRGFAADLVYRTGEPRETVALALQSMLAGVGIRLTLRPADQDRVISDWRAGRLRFFLAGWRFETSDAYPFLLDCLATRNPTRSQGAYNAGFSSAALDRLIAERGRPESAGQYDETMRLATEEMPMVPIYSGVTLYAVSERVEWRPRLDDKLLAAEMSFR